MLTVTLKQQTNWKITRVKNIVINELLLKFKKYYQIKNIISEQTTKYFVILLNN